MTLGKNKQYRSRVPSRRGMHAFIVGLVPTGRSEDGRWEPALQVSKTTRLPVQTKDFLKNTLFAGATRVGENRF